MSQEQGSHDGRQQLEAVLDALNARDFQSLTELLDPAVAFRSLLGATEGEAAYTGIDGLRKWAEEADAIWEDWHQEVVDYREVGENQAVAVIRATGRAKASGVPLDLVFCDELGSPIYPQRLTGWFAKHRKAAGILTGHLHTLRHTSATLALTATPPVPLHVVAGRLGDDPKTVLATYADLLPHSDELAAETVAAVLADKPMTNTPVTA